jgi:hypothetical protein
LPAVHAILLDRTKEATTGGILRHRLKVTSKIGAIGKGFSGLSPPQGMLTTSNNSSLLLP